MRIGLVVVGTLVVAAAGAAVWFALQEAPETTESAPRGSTAATAVAPAAVGRDDARARARAPGAWRKRGDGIVIGALREHGAERPLAGVEVELFAGNDGPDTTLRGTTTSDGAFRFEGVPDFGGWTFRARVVEPKLDVEQGGVSVLPGRTTDLGVIYAVAPANVSGTVVDAAGAPVEGAEVRVLRTFRLDRSRGISDLLGLMVDAPTAVDSARSAADGTFRLTRTPPGSFDVVADRDGFVRAVEHVALLPGEPPRSLRLTLAPGHAVDGRIVRVGEGRLDGVRVRAAPSGAFVFTPWDALARVVFATSDAAGAVRLPGLSAGTWELTAIAEGEMTAEQVKVQVPRSTPVEIRIGGDAWLAGRVTAPGGAPVADARVIVSRMQRVATALSGPDGAYEVRGLASGVEVQVIVEARGFAPSMDLMAAMSNDSEASVFLEPGRNAHDIALAAGATVRGRVVEKGTEKGLEGVRVSVRPDGILALFTGVEAFTGADGRFEVLGVPEGSLRAQLEKTGWHAVGDDGAGKNPFAAMLEARDAEESETDSGKGLAIVAKDGGTVDRVLEMERATVVAGRVVDPDGAGIAGARVKIVIEAKGAGDMDFSAIFSTLMGGEDDDARLTDGSGSFELTAPPGKTFRVSAKAAGFVDGKSETSTGEPGVRIDGVVVKLSRGATIEGLVTSSDGAPVADAEIRWNAAAAASNPMAALAAMGMGQKEKPAAATGPDGRYRLLGVTPGKVTVSVRREGYRAASKDGLEAADGAVLAHDVVLDRGVAVTGTLVDDDGRPVAEAKLRCKLISDKPANPMFPFAKQPADSTGTAMSAADGAFKVEGLGPGRYTVTARAEGMLDGERVEATAGGDAVVVRVIRERRIAGVVRCDGKPVVGAKVSAEREDGKSRESDDEEFDLENLQENLQDLMQDGAGATTKADGTFEIRKLEPGIYKVTAQTAGGAGANVLPSSAGGVVAGTRDVVLECRPGLVIDGTVQMPDGTPPKSGSVEVARIEPGDDAEPAPAGAAENEAGEDEDFDDEPATVRLQAGSFRVVGLRAGRYTVSVTVPGAGRAHREVDAGTTGVTIRLAPAGTISGRAMGPDGKPAGFARVSIRRADAKEHASAPFGEFEMTNPAGRFTVRGVEAGAWVVTIDQTRSGRRRRGSAEVTVVANTTTTVPDVALRDIGSATDEEPEEDAEEDE